MAFSVLLATSDVQIIRMAEALYNLRPGSTYLDNFRNYVADKGVDDFANTLASNFASKTDEELADIVIANVHITGDAATEAKAFLVGQFAADSTARGKAILDGVNVLAGVGADPQLSAASEAFNADVKASLEYSKLAGNTEVAASDAAADKTADDLAALAKAAEALKLTVSGDDIAGTDGDDAFTAKIVDNANTLQTGDVIDGGAGVDTLTADLGTSQSFAITAETNSVEKVVIRAEARAETNDTNDNNMTDAVQIDAERMVGVTHYESNNSRSDLIVEDVRIESNEITKAVTIAMVSTDPGDVDFGVYFDQHSLRKAADTTAGASLNLELMDVRSKAAGLDPLKESPFDGFTFKMDGVDVTIKSADIDAAQTYDEFLTAIQAVITADETISGKITASKSGTFDAIDTDSGATQTGDLIVLTNSGSELLSEGSWTVAGVLPASSGLHTVQSTAQPTSTGSLITSKIILDDVGRGSNGGDLVVGGLSVGDDTDNGTSNSKGVEEFDITVEQSSILGNINSTNNTLREVFIENGTTKGDLTVNGDRSGTANENTNDLPGDLAQDNAFGFSDVRILDASTMVGKVNLTAELTDNIVAKYIDRKDTANDPAQDNSTFAPQNVQNKEFVYTLGTNSDTLSMNISKSNAAATGTTNREDFELTIHGGTGDDAITTIIGDGEGLNTDHWYINSKQNSNLNVNGDAGNDTITTSGAGDVVISAGEGNDTVYTDNTGDQKAQWVFNTDGDDNSANNTVGAVVNANDTEGNGGAADNDELNNLITNLETDNKVTNLLSKGQLVVTFRHLDSVKVTIPSDASHNTSALQVNQAIKTAINSDAVLSKLIVAEDGPADTLVVTSLIDGEADGLGAAANVTDLSVAITAPAAVSTDDLAVINADRLAKLGTGNNLTAAQALTAMVASALSLDTAYGSEFADDAAGEVNGADSNSTNDNTVTGGTGNDVIVLSTDSGDSSQETLVVSGSFGADTVLNFNTAVDSEGMQNGNDVIDLTAYNSGVTANTVSADNVLSANNEIIITSFTDGAKVGAVVQTHKAQVELAVTATANKALSGIVIAKDTTDNVIEIYTALAANDATADAVITFRGSIDFADTNAADFAIADFLKISQSGNEDNLGGVTGGVVAPVAPVVAAAAQTVTVATAAAPLDAAATNTTFTVTSATYTQEIQNFGAGDILDFTSPTLVNAAAAVNTSTTDGTVTLVEAITGNVAAIQLTGLTTAQDIAITGAAGNVALIAALDAAFGAGTII